MSTAILIIRLMPDSPQAPIKKIKEQAREFMINHEAKGLSIEEQEVAFGLKAIMIKAAVPEEKGTDFYETYLQKIPHVSSVSIEDYRRAFG